ncbi:MAG: hypothetical protein U0263_29435 [Polyangiaceae bacterium]
MRASAVIAPHFPRVYGRTNHRDASASWDEAENRATLANIAFVAGGALIVGGSVWLVLSRSGDSVTLGISPNGVVARGSL